jgi:hypothetical protein
MLATGMAPFGAQAEFVCPMDARHSARPGTATCGMKLVAGRDAIEYPMEFAPTVFDPPATSLSASSIPDRPPCHASKPSRAFHFLVSQI